MPQPGAPEATMWDEMTVDQRREVLSAAGSPRYPVIDPDVVTCSWMYLTSLQQTYLKPFIPQVWRRHYQAAPSPVEPEQPITLLDVNDEPDDPEKAQEWHNELATRWGCLDAATRLNALRDLRLLEGVGRRWWEAIAAAPLGLMPHGVRHLLERWLTNLVPVKQETTP